MVSILSVALQTLIIMVCYMFSDAHVCPAVVGECICVWDSTDGCVGYRSVYVSGTAETSAQLLWVSVYVSVTAETSAWGLCWGCYDCKAYIHLTSCMPTAAAPGIVSD